MKLPRPCDEIAIPRGYEDCEGGLWFETFSERTHAFIDPETCELNKFGYGVPVVRIAGGFVPKVLDPAEAILRLAKGEFIAVMAFGPGDEEPVSEVWERSVVLALIARSQPVAVEFRVAGDNFGIQVLSDKTWLYFETEE